MRRRVGLLTAAGFVAVLLLPIALAALLHDEPRRLEGPTLAEVEYREVRFPNREQNLDLAGMLLVPDGAGPFPAAVIIHGSGTSQRDSPWYLAVAGHLRDSGIAVLLPDKRGSESSEGDWRTADFADLATDTLAAVDFLRTQAEVPISTVGVVGMSQGGQVAPIVVRRGANLGFVVSISGSAVPMHDQLLYEEDHNLRQMGVLPGLSHLVARATTAYIRNVAAQEFWQAIGNFDSVTYWRNVRIPALVLYGSEDTNVPTARSTRRLQALENPWIRVLTYTDSGHAIEEPASAGNAIVRQDALQELARFIGTASRT